MELTIIYMLLLSSCAWGACGSTCVLISFYTRQCCLLSKINVPSLYLFHVQLKFFTPFRPSRARQNPYPDPALTL